MQLQLTQSLVSDGAVLALGHVLQCQRGGFICLSSCQLVLLETTQRVVNLPWPAQRKTAARLLTVMACAWLSAVWCQQQCSLFKGLHWPMYDTQGGAHTEVPLLLVEPPCRRNFLSHKAHMMFVLRADALPEGQGSP